MSSEPTDGNEKKAPEQVSILGRYVKPEDLKHLMDFYKADHKLSPKERQLLSDDISTARNISTMWGMFECTIALFAPTLFKKYTDKRSGISPPPGVKRPTFHRPVVSTIFATGVYFCSLYVHSKNHQEYRIAKLSQEAHDSQLNETERESKQRILDVWKAIHPAQLTLFSIYYHETASNPGLIMKNPMEMASADPHAVQYFPPSENNRNGTLAAVQEHERSAPHWEKLREANGFAPPKANTPEEPESDGNSEKTLDSNTNTSETESQGSLSAWERLRKKS